MKPKKRKPQKKRNEKLTLILALIPASIIAVFVYMVFVSFYWWTQGGGISSICTFSPDFSVKGKYGSPTFNCNIIYSRLPPEGATLNKITETACSKEVLNIINETYGVDINASTCEYWCCVTDGTATTPNQQSYNARK